MTMLRRSFLFVPADSGKKLDKAESAGADALILDLEDSVIEANKDRAREMASVFLKTAETESGIWVRINPLDTEHAP